MAFKVYIYKNCDSCRKALKWLKEKNLDFTPLPIRETPPSQSELQKALQSGIKMKDLFNRSGRDYRELGLKDKLPNLSELEAIELLSSNGNLVKRPFLTDGSTFLVGFKEDRWTQCLTPQKS